MKLTDILRQINEEEEVENGIKSPDQANYEVAIVPSDMQAALDALSDSENYVVKVIDDEGNEKIDTDFSRTFADQSKIIDVFGTSNPQQRDKDAMNNWNSLSPVGRRSRLKDIQKRIPEIYKKGIEQKDFVKAYDVWKNEGNEGSEEDFIVNNDYKPGSEFAPIKKVSKAGTLTKYFPEKNADTIKKYAGILSIDTNYDIDGDKIVFPSAKNTWGSKELIKRRIKTIMGNAGVEFKEDTTYQLPDETPTQEPTLSPEPKSSSTTFKITLDPKKIKANKENSDAIKARISQLKNTYEKNFSYSNNILTINNLPPEKKKDLINFFVPYQLKPINEGFDLERYQMLRRAGIIK